MITSLKIWNEPNNVSHWDFDVDPGWRMFSEMVCRTSEAVRRHSSIPLVLGGMSPIDPRFLRVLAERGALEGVDVLAVHGFPLDWNLWPMEAWPDHLSRIRSEFGRPVWVTETGVSSLVSERKAAWGMRRMRDILDGETVYWYTLIDLEPEAEATTRHRTSAGSGYARHYHFGLLKHDGTPKASLEAFDPSLGICQWIQFRDRPTLDRSVAWLRRLGVTRVRTGLSWAESLEQGGWEWLDTIVSALEPFDVCATICFTPKSEGILPDHTSPPRDPGAFARFASEVVRRYAPRTA